MGAGGAAGAGGSGGNAGTGGAAGGAAGTGGAAGGGGGAAGGGGGGAAGGGSADGPVDGKDAPVDGPTAEAPKDLPPDFPAGCPPAAGNEQGVGKPCTRMGGQCMGNKMATYCTCDPFYGVEPPPGIPCFCTKVGAGPCTASAACGSGARCCQYTDGMSTIWSCVPSGCLSMGGVCP